MSTDYEKLLETGTLTLRTRTGEVVTTLPSPAVQLMAENGEAPEGLTWGTRFFRLSEGQYLEGLLYPLYDVSGDGPGQMV